MSLVYSAWVKGRTRQQDWGFVAVVVHRYLDVEVEVGRVSAARVCACPGINALLLGGLHLGNPPVHSASEAFVLANAFHELLHRDRVLGVRGQRLSP